MFARIFEYRFINLDQAKIAANHCSKELGDKINVLNIQSLSITIGKCASLSIIVKFANNQDLKLFEDFANQLVVQLRQSFAFKEGGFPGVMIYNYESEASLEEIKVN
ncbi:MAG: hypothetical protein ABR97_11535 [Rhodobacter sp. BACL10 MAG-120419-bin15]|jgi:hypothetical protein|nr:MAG: hypothetical protein ABR97_11535 [Rhodobacter sp. BACL10 MAG-120419-bin15]